MPATLKSIGGVEQRNKYLAMLDNEFQQLAATPTRGRDCSDIRHGYRKMNVGSHVVFYRQKQSDEIEIVRVLHGRMDIETKIFSTQDELPRTPESLPHGLILLLQNLV